MIARMLPPAHVAVAVRQPTGDGRAEQQMVDPQTGVAGKGVPEIIPERIDALPRMQGPQRVGPGVSRGDLTPFFAYWGQRAIGSKVWFQYRKHDKIRTFSVEAPIACLR